MPATKPVRTEAAANASVARSTTRPSERPAKSARARKEQRPRALLFLGLKTELLQVLEDLSILLGAGVDILSAMSILRDESRKKSLKRLLAELTNELQTGSSLGRALAPYHVVPRYVLALIQTGEESGTLSENLKLAVLYHTKVRRFASRVKSALIYPAIIISLTFFVAIGMGVFVLPRLAAVFQSVNIPLPGITQALIVTGTFFQVYGLRLLPIIVIVFVVVVYVFFIWQRTRFIGMRILFSIPVVRNVVRSNEVARMGYIMGILLRAGLPLIDATGSMRSATELSSYKKFYQYMKDHMEAGESFYEVFQNYRPAPALIPAVARHMIIAGEKGGALPEAFLKVGETFEEKTNVALQNVTVLVEPVILILVGTAVLFAAFAIIMPIYSLLGGVA